MKHSSRVLHLDCSEPLVALPFCKELGKIKSYNEISVPLQLYCVADQPKYSYILLRTCPQRVFTNLWIIHEVIDHVQVRKTFLKGHSILNNIHLNTHGIFA